MHRPATPVTPQRTAEPYFDAEHMRAVMAEHLRWVDGAAVTVQSCVLEQARHSGRRLALQYSVSIRDRLTGSDRRELITAITPIRYRAVRPASEAGAPSSGSPAVTLAPATYVAELKLLLQVFPYDQHLPALPRLLSDPGPLVSRQLPADEMASNGLGNAWTAEMIRYRAGTRATIRLSAPEDPGGDPPGQPRRVYAKLFRNEEAARRAFQIQQALWQRTNAADLGVTVAQPLFLDAATQMVVYGEVPGLNLALLLRLGKDIVPAVRQSARALAGFHQLPSDGLQLDPQPGSNRDDAVRLRRVHERLRADAPRLRPEIDDTVEMIATHWVSRPGALTLFDLRPSHVVPGEQTALLDLDKIAVADPIVDVANMMAILDRVSNDLHTRLGLSLRLPEIFQEAYMAHAPAERGERLPAAYALALLSRASRALHDPVPRNPVDEDLVASVLRKAQDALREAGA